MTPYIYLSETDEGLPIVVVSNLDDDASVEVDWPADARGLRNAGRHVWLAFSRDGYAHSSTLDFPRDYGVALDAHDLILQGIEEARRHDG
jgi:hypothetical protein